jgi:PAS domain-containing protein
MQDYLRVLHCLPHAYLVLTPDFTIIDANPAYCGLTFTDPEHIRGRNMFKVFPDNPGDPEANGVRNLTTSLKIVLAKKHKDAMPWQRYDIRDRSGIFLERHWSPVNSPICDDNGEVRLIVHHVSDVTRVARKFPRTYVWPVAR